VTELPAGAQAVVNVNCLDDRERFTSVPALHNFEGETIETRSSRRAGNRMPVRTQDPRRRDQEQRGEPAILCRVGQHGEIGEWSAEDAEGRPLEVRTGGDGRLKIVHYPNATEDEDPDELRMQQPPGTEGQWPPAGPSEDRRRAARDIAQLQPGRVGQGDYASTKALQRTIDAHYRQGRT
jgi:hypothetical protein